MGDERWIDRDDGDWAVDPDASPEVTVPWDALSPAALRGVIEEFVTREGTEYGASDVSLDEKVLAVRRQLERGEVELRFDAKTETVNLVVATRRR